MRDMIEARDGIPPAMDPRVGLAKPSEAEEDVSEVVVRRRMIRIRGNGRSIALQRLCVRAGCFRGDAAINPFPRESPIGIGGARCGRPLRRKSEKFSDREHVSAHRRKVRSDDQQTYQRIDEVIRIPAVPQAPLDAICELCLLIYVVAGSRVPASVITDHPVEFLDLFLANVGATRQCCMRNQALNLFDGLIGLLFSLGSIKPFQHFRIAFSRYIRKDYTRRDYTWPIFTARNLCSIEIFMVELAETKIRPAGVRNVSSSERG